MDQVIISIGREFGSAGREIAQRLAKHYDLPIYDKNLLKEIAVAKNVDLEALEEFDERKRNKLLYRTVRGMNSSPQDNVANLQFEYLKKKAAEGQSFVVVGRCAETVLKDEPSMISIFITGDMEHKMARIEKLYNLTGVDAKVFIESENMKRKYYHNSHCKRKWGDSRCYDLTINSSRLGIHGTEDILVKYIDARREAMNKQS